MAQLKIPDSLTWEHDYKKIRRRILPFSSSKLLTYWELFIFFLKLGPMTFGGGYAMIPLLEREMIEKKRWMSNQDLSEIVALAGSVPGAMAINIATFTGYRRGGLVGAMMATIGILIPTFILILALSFVYLQFEDNAKVEAAFQGIAAGVVALIAFAGYKIAKTALYDKVTWVIMSLVLLVLFFTSIHPVLIIVIGLATGIVLVKLKSKLGFETKLTKEPIHTDSDYYMGEGI